MSDDDARFLSAWDETLDTLSYYAILKLDPDASPENVTSAFHRFCEAFHPDLHGGRPLAELQRVNRIFTRGVEAYRVLASPRDRQSYDAALEDAEGRSPRASSARPPIEAAPSPPTDSAPPPALDGVAPAAQLSAARAQELLYRGEYGAAKLHAELALVHDPKSRVLQSLATWLARKVTSGKE